MVNREPERTPQTAPDLEALSAKENRAYWDLHDKVRVGFERVPDEYRAAVEARVRAEEEHILRIAHVNTTATLEANITLRAERDAARAEVAELRERFASMVGDEHALLHRGLGKGPDDCTFGICGEWRAVLSTEEAH